MTIAALIALIPAILDGAKEVSDLVARLQAEGRAHTTEEEAQALRDSLARRLSADQRFDAAFGLADDSL